MTDFDLAVAELGTEAIRLIARLDAETCSLAWTSCYDKKGDFDLAIETL